MEVVAKNPQETQKLAEKIAEDILFCHSERKRGISKRFFGLPPALLRKAKRAGRFQNDHNGGGRKAIIIALEGDLGGGKTTFVQGFAKGLGVKDKILSPTFVLIKRFRLKNKDFSDFYHIDCYRINNPKELLDLEFEKIINNPKNIVIIEWAERIEEILPEEKISIKFRWLGGNKRGIKISNKILNSES